MFKKEFKGSVTIEMAYIMPVIFLVFTAAVYMGFYCHDKNVLQGIVYESVVIGCSNYENSQEELEDLLIAVIEEKSQERLFYFSIPEVEVNITDAEITVNATTTRNQMKIEIIKTGTLQEPEKEIRTNLMLQEKIEEIEEVEE